MDSYQNKKCQHNKKDNRIKRQPTGERQCLQGTLHTDIQNTEGTKKR